MKILVTGFDPFGGESVNPAYEAVKLLPDTIGGAQIFKLEIPTVFSLSGPAVEEGPADGPASAWRRWPSTLWTPASRTTTESSP